MFSYYIQLHSVRYICELLVKANTKSWILDPAPTCMLKRSIALAPTITSIINASVLSGLFPSSLKEAVIYPSIKKLSLDREACPSYRLITNVAFLIMLTVCASPHSFPLVTLVGLGNIKTVTILNDFCTRSSHRNLIPVIVY